MALVGKKVWLVRGLTKAEVDQQLERGPGDRATLADIRIIEFEDGSSVQGIMIHKSPSGGVATLEPEFPAKPKTKQDFPIGAKVRFTQTTTPQYMRGIQAVVSGHGNIKVKIKLSEPCGRFRANEHITCPPGILELAP